MQNFRNELQNIVICPQGVINFYLYNIFYYKFYRSFCKNNHHTYKFQQMGFHKKFKVFVPFEVATLLKSVAYFDSKFTTLNYLVASRDCLQFKKVAQFNSKF